MPSPRLLVIEGNSPQTTAEHVAVGGTAASKGYSDLLRELLPGAVVDICYPGDPTALLPEGSSLEGYDGIAITGSSLHVYNGGPEVMRQIDLVRAALKTGTPLFGSCWGFRSSPRRPAAVSARIRRGAKSASAAVSVSPKPAANIRCMRASSMCSTRRPCISTRSRRSRRARQCWRPMPCPMCKAPRSAPTDRSPGPCNITRNIPCARWRRSSRRIGTRLIEEGFFADTADIKTFAQDLDTLDRDPGCKRLAWRHGISKNVLDKKLSVGEVANWIEFQVLPTRVKRGRG